MRKFFLIGLLLTASAWAQSGLPVMGSTWQGAAASGPIVCVQGGPGCTNTTSTKNGASNATSLTFTFPGAVTAGNAQFVLVSSFHQPTSVVGGSDTLTAAISTVGTTANQYVGIYYKLNSTGGNTTVVVTLPAGSYAYGQALEMSGVLTSSALDTSATQSGNSGTGCTAPPAGTNCLSATGTNPNSATLTPSVSGDVFFTVGWNSNNASTFLNWTGGTLLFDDATANVADGAYLISTTSAAQTPGWTLASSTYIYAIAAFKP